MPADDLMSFIDTQLSELLQSHPELRTKQRAFTAWVLLHLSEVDISEPEAIDSIVDGNQEKGLDAVFVPEMGGRIVVLQTILHEQPRGKGIRKNDLVRLFAGVDWLLEGDLSRINRNPTLRAKAEEFREAYVDFDYSAIEIVLATTAANGPSQEEKDEIERFSAKLAQRGVPSVIETLSATEIREMLVARAHRRFRIDLDLKFVGKPFNYERPQIGARAIVGVVKGAQLADLFCKHGYRIFEVNIRNFLGNVKINLGIAKTATDPSESKKFWFYNNGITFVCDEFAFRSLEDTVVRLENAQIINGCQTVMSLSRVATKVPDEVEVLVKVIEKKADIEFVRRVTLFANSQNAVRPADLVGTDTLVLELKRRLLPIGFYLETRRGDYKAERDSLAQPVSAVATLKETAQAVATCFNQFPGVAKKDTSKLFLSNDDGGFFDSVFTPKTVPDQLVTAVTLMRAIRKMRAQMEISSQACASWLPHSDFFLSALFFRVFFPHGKLRDEEYLRAFSVWLSDERRPFKCYQSLVRNVAKIVRKHEKAYGYSHPKFFKTQVEYDSSVKNAVAKKPLRLRELLLKPPRH